MGMSPVEVVGDQDVVLSPLAHQGSGYLQPSSRHSCVPQNSVDSTFPLKQQTVPLLLPEGRMARKGTLADPLSTAWVPRDCGRR